MRWVSDYKHPKRLNFIIDKDLPSGFYIYMYSNPDLFQKDLNSDDSSCKRHQDDYCQDTLEAAKRCAFRVYEVPIDSWRETK